MIRIGCIADDFTGASDWASFFAEKGIRVLLFSGIPEDVTLPDADVAVIALKTRTIDTREAVRQSLEALRWLGEHDTQQYYIKYCSTFDCTPTGNIGPVIDAAMDFLGENVTVICPSLPVNGRTVLGGKLYVNGVELQESSMKDHPLTPMWDCRISELLKKQSTGRTANVSAALYKDSAECQKWICKAEQENKGRHLYFVPDYYEEGQAERIVHFFGDRKLLTGGSGLSRCLADRIRPQGKLHAEEPGEKVVLFAGSCSMATLGQIRKYRETGGACIAVDPIKLMDGSQTADSIREAAKGQENVLIYSSQESGQVRENQRLGREQVSCMIEETMAQLAKDFFDSGYKRIIVAGGETSGSITGRLGFRSFYVGKSIAPGVPILIPSEDTAVRLVLKSGNFGQEDFFMRAVEMTGELD